MKTIHFVRHGESVANAGGITMPNAQIPLTEKGHEQAKRVAEMLPSNTSLILCSEFLRAQQTAGYFADKVNLAVETEPLLNEFNTLCHTLIDGLTGEQRKPIAEKYWAKADPHVVMGPTAESFFQSSRRVADFHEYVLQELPDQTVIFGHGMWFGMLCWRILGFDYFDSWAMRAFRRYQSSMPMPNCFSYQIHISATDVNKPLSVRADSYIIREMLGVQFPNESKRRLTK